MSIPHAFNPLGIGGEKPFHGYVSDGLIAMIDIEDGYADANGKLQLVELVTGQDCIMVAAPDFENRYAPSNMGFGVPRWADNRNLHLEWTGGNGRRNDKFATPFHGYHYVYSMSTYGIVAVTGPVEGSDYPIRVFVTRPISGIHSFSLATFDYAPRAWLDGTEVLDVRDGAARRPGLSRSTCQYYYNASTADGSILGNYRVYNRLLTDAERLHNYEIDKKRFNIA